MISKLQLIKSSIISKHENEKGIVLVAAIGLVAILALFGTVSVVTTSTELIISRNHKTSVQASYATQAGIEEARLRLRGRHLTLIMQGIPLQTLTQHGLLTS